MNDLCTDICDLSPAYPPELANVSLANRIRCDKLTINGEAWPFYRKRGNGAGFEPKDLCQVEVAEAKAA